MIRRIAAIAVAWLAAVAAPAHAAPPAAAAALAPPDAAQLANQTPIVELVTMGVGSLIWERHGHIALCVYYDDPRDDSCYNYGIGDFHQPVGMAWGFFRASGAFWVGKSSPEEMLWIYKHTDRTIWGQRLPLTAAQKQQVIAKLEHDILPENRAYAYDHFWDNCTTRVRDILDTATGGKLSGMPEIADDRTFRDLAREGFYGMRVPLLITDLAMGRATDRVPSYYERMFLPQYLREAATKLWGLEPVAKYTRHGEPPPTESPSGRVWFALVILLLTSPAWITRLIGRLSRTGLALSVIPYVLLGSVLTFLAIISPLPYIRWNEICLVLFPFDLLLLVLPAERRRRYARGRLAMLGAILVLSVIGVLRQPLLAPLLWPAIPLAVTGFWPVRPARVGQAGETAGATSSTRGARTGRGSKRS
jgi:uncharacterized protein DUF4105